MMKVKLYITLITAAIKQGLSALTIPLTSVFIMNYITCSVSTPNISFFVNNIVAPVCQNINSTESKIMQISIRERDEMK